MMRDVSYGAQLHPVLSPTQPSASQAERVQDISNFKPGQWMGATAKHKLGGSEITCPVCVWIEDAYEIHRFGQCLCFGCVPLANIRMPAETLGCLFRMVSRSVDVLNARALDGPHPNMRLPAQMSRPLLVCGSKKTC